MAKIAKKRPYRKIQYGAADLKENMLVIVFAKAATRLAKILFIHKGDGDPIPWVRVQLMGRDRKDKNVFKAHWLDERKRDSFTKRNKNYEEFWVDLYPRDVFYILKYPLMKGHMDREIKPTLTVFGAKTYQFY